MSLYYDLPVFKDVYALTLRLFQLTQNFSREYKFTLGQDMKRDAVSLVRSIYRANKCKDKVQYLEKLTAPKVGDIIRKEFLMYSAETQDAHSD